MVKTLKTVWAHNKFTAVVMVATTIGWTLLFALAWWGLAFIGAGLGWVLIMSGATALFFLLFWFLWSQLGKVYG